MVTFEINGSKRTGSEITPEWVAEQFRIANGGGKPLAFLNQLKSMF